MNREKIKKILLSKVTMLICFCVMAICLCNMPVGAASITAAIDYIYEVIVVDGGDDENIVFYSVEKDAEKAASDNAKWSPLIGDVIDISKVIPKKSNAVIYIGIKSSDSAVETIEVKGRPDIKSLKIEAKTFYNGTNAFVNESKDYGIEFKIGLAYDWIEIWKLDKTDEIYHANMFPTGATGVVRIMASDNSFASAEVKFKINAMPKAPNGDKIVFEQKGDNAPTIRGLTNKMEVCREANLSASEMPSTGDNGYDNFWLDVTEKNMTVSDFVKALTGDTSISESSYTESLGDFLKGDDYVFTVRFKATEKKSASALATFKISKTYMAKAFAVRSGNEISLVDIKSPVKVNSQGSVKVMGMPKTEYSIEVHYPSGESVAKGLDNETSDKDGIVSWSWKIGSNTTPGKHNLTISGGGASLEVEFVVVE